MTGERRTGERERDQDGHDRHGRGQHRRQGGPATGLGRMTWLALRTGWPGLLATVALVVGLVTVTAGSIGALYPARADRLTYASTVGGSPATQAFNGRGFGLDTVGGITAYEVGFMGQILFPALALWLAVRHTRREEEAGRTELVTSGRVGRLAPLLSAAVVLAGTVLVTGAAVLVGLVSTGLPLTGSAWYAAGVALVMGGFGSVGLLIAQLTQTTRSAHLIGLAVVTASFLVRAVVDGRTWAMVWLSPLGWLAEIRAFGEPQAWPLVAYAVLALLLLLAATWVAGVRDLGAGVITPAPGPARGTRALGTVTGSAWRLTRSATVSWAGLAALWSAVFGGLADEMTELVDANPTLLEALGIERGSDVVTSLAAVVTVLAATSVAVQGFGHLGAEETAGRIGTLLATRVPRGRLWLGWSAVVIASSLAVLALGCASLGLATWVSTGDRDALGTALEVGAGYAVPVAFVGALAGALRAAAPTAAPLAWVLVGWVVTVGFLAETLRLPGWARDLSPLHLVGELPREDVDVVATAALGLAALALVVAATAAFRRRDLLAG